MSETNSNAREFFPIGTAARRTGVNPITLRAWERRYGLIKPQRTHSGHRLYGEQDIALIKEVLRLVEEGVPISRVSDALEQQALAPDQIATAGGEAWDDYRAKMIDAITGFDEMRLENIYNEVMSLYPVDVVNRRLLMPLLRELGERWRNHESGVAEEHFFAAYMRNKLGARFHHRSRQTSGPLLVTTCIEGERHEIGLLLFSLAAHDRGFRIILLGADMPMEQLAPVAKRTKCDALVLSGSVDPDAQVLNTALPFLVRVIKVPVFVGGQTATRHEAAIRSAGAFPVGDDLVLGLKQVQADLDRIRIS